MKCKVSATSKGCSSDEVVTVFQGLLDKLYLPDAKGNFAAPTLDDARDILYSSQVQIYGFMKNLVNQLEDDEALAVLAEIDHKLDYHDPDFKVDFDVQPTGSSEGPYTIVLQYGDQNLGFVKMTVNDLSQ